MAPIVVFVVYSAWIFGDPHFTTLDRLEYTFNGHGEYILVNADALQIQCRTDRALTTDGNSSHATIFSAFALQGSDVWIQVELTDDRDRMSIYAGRNNSSWTDFTADFYNTEDEIVELMTIDGLILERNVDSQTSNYILTTVFTETGNL